MKVRMAVEQPNKDAFIEQVMCKYHFSTEEKEALQQVYEKVRTYMAPYAIYRINTRMRGVPLLDAEQSALVAMTLGEGVDRYRKAIWWSVWQMSCFCRCMRISIRAIRNSIAAM